MYQKIQLGNFYFYKPENSSLWECSRWAYFTAFKKFHYTSDTWQPNRGCLAKFVDIYYGDFAKNIVLDFLNEVRPGFSINEYDRIRTDDFTSTFLFSTIKSY